jgi:hypothetical protein
MFNFSNKKVLYGYMSCCMLGFYRGAGHYKFNHTIEMARYEKSVQEKNSNKKPEFFYHQYFISGIFGMMLYGNPISLLIMLPKELYRLEVNLRNMEDEKKTSNYNDIL